MDLGNIFCDVGLSKTEVTVLYFIQDDPEQRIRQGVHVVTGQCYSNPSSLVRLAKKLKPSGRLEPVYFIKFNITIPKLDVTNDIDYMSVQPEEALTLLPADLKQWRILTHGSDSLQLVAQYIYNKFFATGANVNLALQSGYEILEQKNAACFDSIWVVSRSGRSSLALNWVRALEGKEINLVCFTGNHQSSLAQAANTAFVIYDPQKFDDDVHWNNPFSGYCALGFERLLKMWLTSPRSNSQPSLSAAQAGEVPRQRPAFYPGYRVMRQFCREAAYV